MKIGLVRRGYSPTGGAENYLRRFVAALRAAGHEGVLFGSPEWPTDARPAGVDFVPVRGQSPRTFSDALDALRPREHCEVLFSLERVAHCDCYRAGDGVHRAWLERRAQPADGRSSAQEKFQAIARRWNPKHRELLALEKALFRPDGSGARGVIANSRMVADEFHFYYRYPPGRIGVVPNGLPATAFEPVPPGVRESERRRLELEATDYAVLFAGSGWERKGLRCAAEAILRLDARHRGVLLVAGSGNRRELPPAAINSPRVRLLGPVPGAQMKSLYAAADVFLLPTRYDPFSNACLEAFAAGLPVLTTVWNGFKEVLKHGDTGDVIPSENPAAVIGSLTRWADPERRRAARPRILETASRYTIEANVQATLGFLTHLPATPAGF